MALSCPSDAIFKMYYLYYGSHKVGLYTETGMAMLALREAPYSVDSFFFIGATLVAYLLLKVLLMVM